jgi:hypothetical protein
MRIFIKTLLLIGAIIITGCDENDDIAVPTDGFSYDGEFYETPNAYIEMDEDDDNNDGFPDNYIFFFSDGRMFDNDANVNNSSGDYLFSLNTSKLVFLKVLVSDNPSLATSQPTAGNTYIVSSIEDTVVIHDGQIDPLTPSYFNSNLEFGMGNENVGTFHFPGAVAPTITINSINLDMLTPSNSTINTDYSFMNEDGEVITGHYEGTFGVILD